MTKEIIEEANRKMGATIESLSNDFSGIRAGKANAALFNSIHAEYYGTPTPLSQLATAQVQDHKTVLFQVFDASALSAIEKALRDSDLGVNPAREGNSIRVVLPDMSSERRAEYTKLAAGKAEDAKIALRGVRHKAIDQIDKKVKDKEIGEDDGKRAEKEVDDLIHKFNAEIDKHLAAKQADLLQV